MQMLLLVIVETDVKPTTAVWTQVASKLGDITPTAVRYDSCDGPVDSILLLSNSLCSLKPLHEFLSLHAPRIMLIL
jgi:hypothetical protein